MARFLLLYPARIGLEDVVASRDDDSVSTFAQDCVLDLVKGAVAHC